MNLSDPWLTSFSMYTNLMRLVSTEVTAETLLPLNGLRFLSIAWIILGHRYYFATSSAVMNLLEIPEVGINALILKKDVRLSGNDNSVGV